MNPVKDLASIYWDAVREVDPAGLIHSRVKKDGSILVIHGQATSISEDLSRYKRIIILGIGKASASMASAVESIIGDDLSEGFIITKYGHGLNLRKIQVMEAGHPVPDENSLEGTRILTKMADTADEHTLIINLISGGGSSLFCLPADGISLEDKRQTTGILLASGASIDEINCVRKHLSKVKGGGFAQIAHPARLINLILSD
ncbi:MAG: glycerate-2-kinase family protein, partial [Smithella sp.]